MICGEADDTNIDIITSIIITLVLARAVIITIMTINLIIAIIGVIALLPNRHCRRHGTIV
jgi:hypothetical protein